MADPENPLLDIPEMEGVPIAPAHGISALAMNFALKWLDMTLVKDGVLYQQKKMEGVNFHLIDLPEVFEVARKFEAWLMMSPNRLSEMVLEGVAEAIFAELPEPSLTAVIETAPDGEPA